MFVVGSDVLHQLPAEISGRGEDASGNALALNLGEPQLHLVELPAEAEPGDEDYESDDEAAAGLPVRFLLSEQVAFVLCGGVA